VGGAGAVLGVEDVDAVPAAGRRGCGGDGCSVSIEAVNLYERIRTFLQQHAARKAIIHVPQKDARYAALKIPAPVSTHHPQPIHLPYTHNSL
jgi:hypothetical protein